MENQTSHENQLSSSPPEQSDSILLLHIIKVYIPRTHSSGFPDGKLHCATATRLRQMKNHLAHKNAQTGQLYVPHTILYTLYMYVGKHEAAATTIRPWVCAACPVSLRAHVEKQNERFHIDVQWVGRIFVPLRGAG